MKLNTFLFVVVLAATSFLVSCKNDKNTATATTTQTVTPENNGVAEPPLPLTQIEIQEDTYDFGTIKEGTKVEHIYKFKNIGTQPLYIKDAKGSCGCTVPEWSKEPISPGEMGELKATFNSAGKAGPDIISKRVTMTCNTEPAQSFLTIKGRVLANPDGTGGH